MKRIYLVVFSFVAILTASAPVLAWTTTAQVVITNRKATSVTTAYSSRFEILIHRLTTTAVIKEEGVPIDTHNVTCYKQAGSNNLPLDLYCTSRAHDPSSIPNCEYCAGGYSEGYTFALISQGIVNAAEDCRRYVL